MAGGGGGSIRGTRECSQNFSSFGGDFICISRRVGLPCFVTDHRSAHTDEVLSHGSDKIVANPGVRGSRGIIFVCIYIVYVTTERKCPTARVSGVVVVYCRC